MTTEGSVSKGVFVFKGKKKLAKAENLKVVGTDNVELSRERMGMYEEMWEGINDKIRLLQTDLNGQIFEDLVKYVDGAQQNFKLNKGQDHHILQEIPTAALITGVNMPDHASMFSTLAALLVESVSPHIAVLKSKDCPNIKSIMNNTLSQLMQNAELDYDEDDEETVEVKVRKISTTMSALTSWYKHTCQQPISPRKRNNKGSPSKNKTRCPPVVIVFEDLEGFPANVLQDFITICSNHIKELPLVLVLGIATNVTVIHRLLPHAVSSMLSIERFQAPPPTEYLSQVIDQVLITADFPIKLGPKVFSLLLDLFLFHDFSVLNFVRGFQFSMLNHFYSKPESILCQNVEEAIKQLKSFNHVQLEQIRRLMSFRRYVENSRPEEQIELLENDRHTKKVVGELLLKLDTYHDYFFPFLRCLHCLTQRLPGYPLGKHLREIYASSLCSNITQTRDYDEAILLLRNLSRDELVASLSQCQGHLNSANVPQDLMESADKISEILKKLDNLEELAKDYVQEGDLDEENPETQLLPKKMDMFTLKQKLQEMEKKKKKLTVYEVLRNEAIDLLDICFKEHLTCAHSHPLHEIVYYNDAATVRRHINGSPRATIQTALNHPHRYLHNSNLKPVDDTISPNLPDVCIVYKLHLECGRLINLYDWMQAFIGIMQSEDSENEEQQLQARFIRAVSELQFLGYIKPTKRKTDHVQRLTWGGC